MLRRRSFVLVIMSALTLAHQYPLAGDEAIELARMLPPTANVISILRVGKLLKTRHAVTNDWANSSEHRFLSGGSSLPPWVDTLVVGALVRPAVPEEVWSAGVLRVPSSVTMERIARHEESRVERIGTIRAVNANRNAWMLELSKGTLGVWSPAIRQEAFRWARAVESGIERELSPYLRRAASDKSDIVIAMDLQDIAGETRIREFLTESGLLPDDPVARVELPRLLSGLQGVSFLVSVDEEIHGTVMIDFNDQAAGLTPHAARVFRQLVSDHHMHLDEFDTATIGESGRSVSLKMKLSDSSLRRVASLITTPAPPHRSNDSSVPAEPPPSTEPLPRVEIELTASKRYFRSVSQAIDDLSRVSRKGTDYSKTATWHENFARKIEHLSTSGVERDLIAFGRRTSERFRALAASLRGQGVQVNAEQQTLVYDYDYRPGWAAANWWGAVGYGEPSVKVSSNLQQVRERQAAAVVKGSQQRSQIWKLIEKDRSDVESRMRATYGDDFFRRR